MGFSYFSLLSSQKSSILQLSNTKKHEQKDNFMTSRVSLLYKNRLIILWTLNFYGPEYVQPGAILRKLG